MYPLNIFKNCPKIHIEVSRVAMAESILLSIYQSFLSFLKIKISFFVFLYQRKLLDIRIVILLFRNYFMNIKSPLLLFFYYNLNVHTYIYDLLCAYNKLLLWRLPFCIWNAIIYNMGEVFLYYRGMSYSN